MIVSLDTAAAIQPITTRTTPVEYLTRVALLAIDSWVAQYGGTRDEAIGHALDVAQPDVGAKVGVRRQIRTEAARRKEAGGFLPALPAGNAKWLPSGAIPGADRTMADLLAELVGTDDAVVSTLQIKALDGSNYSWTPAKVKSASTAMMAQRRAIDTARNNAIAQFEAAQAATPPQPFDVSAIVWPAQYGAP